MKDMKVYSVTIAGFMDEDLAKSFADYLRRGNLPDTLTVTVQVQAQVTNKEQDTNE
jgi:hypothetical protein